MVEAHKRPDAEQINTMRDSLSDARVHFFGDFSEGAMIKELEGHFRELIEPDMGRRIQAVAKLGDTLADREFSGSKTIESSAAHILAACIKDPHSKVRMLTAKKLQAIIKMSPVTSMRHVISLNALKIAPKWGKLFGKWK